MHTKAKNNTEPRKQWEIDKTINQQQKFVSVVEVINSQNE